MIFLMYTNMITGEIRPASDSTFDNGNTSSTSIEAVVVGRSVETLLLET